MKNRASTNATRAIHIGIVSGLHGRTTRIRHVLAASALTMAAFASMAQNPITWGPATNVSGDSDVRTDGTLVRAFNIGSDTVTATVVNGVTFSPFAFPDLIPVSSGPSQTVTVDGVTFSGTGQYEYLSSSMAIGGTGSPFNVLSSDYQILLGSAGTTTAPADLMLSFVSLTIGNQYLIQMWSGVSESDYNQGFWTGSSVQIRDQGGSNTRILDVNTTDASSGLGQFVVGTFTATASTLEIYMEGSGFIPGSVSTSGTGTSSKILTPPSFPVLNGFQLRDITAAAIPETSGVGGTWVLMGSLGLLSMRRRRSAH